MKKLFLALLLALTPAISMAQTHKGISLQLYIMKQNGQPMNQNQLTVRTRVLSTNDCVLIDETHSNIDIVNGYMRVAVGSGARGGADKGLSLASALSNASAKSNLDHLSGAQGTCSVTPGSQDPRKLKVTFSLGSENVEANFTVRSSAYAVVADEAQTLNGKQSSEFIQKNDAKNLTQSKVEEFFDIITSQVNKSVKFDGTNFVAYEPAAGGGGSVDLSNYLTRDGATTMAGNLLPDSTAAQRTLGSTTQKWKNVYSDTVTVGNVLQMGGNGIYGIASLFAVTGDSTPTISAGGLLLNHNTGANAGTAFTLRGEQGLQFKVGTGKTLDFNAHPLKNIGEPIDPQDAATKAFVESLIGSIAPSEHTHSSDDITSGTLSIARLPVGTAAGTVAAGNDPRFSDARTPLTHSHAASDVTGVLSISQGGTGNGSISGRGKLIATDLSTGTTMAAISCALNELVSFDAQGAYQCISAAAFGTVKSITAGSGLSGGTITGSGTIAVNFGTTSGTVAQGNDSRFGDAQKIQAKPVSATAPTDGQSLAYNSSSGQWEPQSIAGMDVPVGTIISYAGSTCPAFYLPANGATFSSSLYPALFTVLGSSTTPNLQGLFLRGAGSQTVNGVTYSATLGQFQHDQMQGHSHDVKWAFTADGKMPLSTQGSTQSQYGAMAGAGNAGNQGFYAGSPISDGNGTPRTGTESRPANYAVTFCIKAANSISVKTSDRTIRVAFGGAATLGTNCNGSTGTTCHIQSQTITEVGGLITQVDRINVGTYQINFPTAFSGPPSCFGGGQATGHNLQAPWVISPTKTSVLVVLRNTAGTTVDGEANITCTGPMAP